MLYSEEQIQRANDQSISDFFGQWDILPIMKAEKCTYTASAA